MFSISTRMVGTVLAATAVTATMVLAAPAQAAVSGPGAAPDAGVACGATFPDKDSSPLVTMTNNNVNLRTGPGTDCTSKGQVQQGARLNYFCYAPGHDNFTWTYLADDAGRRGWIRDDLLPNNGSSVRC